MESLIMISIKLKYDHQTQCFKRHLDEGWNGRGTAAAKSKGEGNNAHKGTLSISRDRTNIGVVLDAPPPALPIHKNTNGKNYKNDDGGFYFVAALLLPPKSGGGGADFPLDNHLTPPSTVAPALYPETMGQRRRRRTPCPCRMTMVSPFSLCCWHLRIPGRSEDFPSSSPPPPPSTVAPDLSPEKRWRRRISRTPRPWRLLLSI